jgi:hypothetical protein
MEKNKEKIKKAYLMCKLQMIFSVPLGIAFMILMLFEYFNPNFHVFFKSDYP